MLSKIEQIRIICSVCSIEELFEFTCLTMNHFDNSFGLKLRDLRKQHHITLQHLAEIMGYSTHSYISEIESGQKVPTVPFVIKISRLFNISLDTLLKDEMLLDVTISIFNKDNIL